MPISGSNGGLYVNEKFSGDIDTLLRRKELHFIVTEEMISDSMLPEFETRLQNLVSAGKPKCVILYIIFDIV